MKKFTIVIFYVLITFLINTIEAQNSTSNKSVINDIITVNQKGMGNVSVSSRPNKAISGSVYLFQSSNNNSEVYLINGQKLTIKNININLQKNSFESKIYNDSILTLDLEQVDKVVINGKIFKGLKDDFIHKIYEVIYEKDDRALLRGSVVKLIEKSLNPMLNRTEDKYIQKNTYYLKENENIKKINPNKKNILALVDGNEKEAIKVENYVKKYNSNLKKSSFSSREKVKQDFLDEIKKNGLSVFQSSSSAVKQLQKTVEGTKYFFEDWNNRAFIYASNGERMIVNKVNLNMQEKVFESKFINDITFIFSFRNIEKIVVKNRTFKKYYGENDIEGVYELIYESDKFSLLKKFSIKHIPASPNPMTSQKERYIRQYQYFFKKNNEIKPFKMKKKNVISLIGLNDDGTIKMNNFVKMNRLSFKKENDLKRILDFTMQQF
jgi:hypothetical protein